jgi:hypothetical protein
MTFEQAIRFLTDYLQGDPYYKVSRDKHNLDRCRTQFKLLESIEQEEKNGSASGVYQAVIRLGEYVPTSAPIHYRLEADTLAR